MNLNLEKYDPANAPRCGAALTPALTKLSLIEHPKMEQNKQEPGGDHSLDAESGEALLAQSECEPQGLREALRSSRSNASLKEYYTGGTPSRVKHSRSNASLHDYYEPPDTDVVINPCSPPDGERRDFCTIKEFLKTLESADPETRLPQEVVSAVLKFTQPRKTTMIQGRRTAFALSVFNLMNGAAIMSIIYL